MNQGVKMKAGTRLFSPHTTCEVVVVRPADADVEVTCGGLPMVGDGELRDTAQGQDSEGETLIGKRYRHPATGLEVLCTKGGAGVLSIGGQPLEQVESRPLPASD